MKRIIACLLCICLISLCAPALASPGDAVILRRDMDGFSGSISDYAAIGNTVYVYTYNNGLYKYENETLTKYDCNPNALLVNDDEDSEKDGGHAIEMRKIMVNGDTLVGLTIENSYDYSSDDEGMSSVLGAWLYEIRLNDEDLTVSFENPIELDWDDMIDGSGNYEYSREVQYPFIQNGKLVFFTYGFNGGYEIMVYDLKSGDCEILECEDLYRIAAYKDDLAIVTTYSYESDKPSMGFSTFDLSTGDTEPLFTYRQEPFVNYEMPSEIVCDGKTGYLYFVLSGELYRVENMDIATAQSVAALPVDNWSGTPPYLLDNGLIVMGDYSQVILRNTDPSQRATIQLKVFNTYSDAVNTAVFTFQKLHPDVEVILKNSASDILQAMMSRSEDMDIYYGYVANSDYKALYNRGYMAELTGSEKLTSFIDSMYESIQNVVKKDGELLALPIDMYGDCMSVNLQALEKIGLTEEDLPNTWLELMQFLAELPEHMEGTDVTVFEPYYSARNAQSDLAYRFISEYIYFLATEEDASQSFDTPVFKDTLTTLEKVDFEALGMPAEEDENYDYSYVEDNILFRTYSNLSVYSGRSQSGTVPMPLSMGEGLEKRIYTDLNVLYVNPFSQNRELATEFLEIVADETSAMNRILYCPGENEPIPSSYYEENIKYYDEQIELAEQNLEKAADDEKLMYQEQLDQVLGYKEEYSKYGMWEASEESIAHYRKYAEYIEIRQGFGMDGENSQEIYTQISQYVSGAIDVDTFVKNIDKKLKMMIMEGM